MLKKSILIISLLLISVSLFAQKEPYIKIRANFLPRSEYFGKSTGSDVYNINGPNADGRLESIDRGMGLEAQISLSKIDIIDFIDVFYIEKYGYGLVLNAKWEKLQAYPSYPIEDYVSTKDWHQSLNADLGLAFYLFSYEAHIGAGRAFFSDPLAIPGIQSPDVVTQIKPDGFYIFLRQYLNIPIYKNFALNAGLSWNWFLEPFIIEYPDSPNNLNNMYFNFGATYRFNIKSEKKK